MNPHPDDFELTPGEVIDTADLDAKLVVIRLHGSPHFTGAEMEIMEEHFRKGFSDLTVAQAQTATAYIYLRRAKGPGVTWDIAAEATIDYGREVDPTEAASSETWPPSATSSA